MPQVWKKKKEGRRESRNQSLALCVLIGTKVSFSSFSFFSFLFFSFSLFPSFFYPSFYLPIYHLSFFPVN